MVATKTLFLMGGIFIGFILLMVIGIGLLVFLVEEISNDGKHIAEFDDESRDNGADIGESEVVGGLRTALQKVKSLWPYPFSIQAAQENEGNELTGQATGWLFGIACVPVVFCLSTGFINRQTFIPSRLKGSLRWFTRTNKKYLMPFHTYLSILAMILGVVHLIFSSCPNPLPEWGLFIAGILVTTGLLIKLRFAAKLFPKAIKYLYKFHASLVVSGILALILIAGHTLMD
jgi:hypothetical protein